MILRNFINYFNFKTRSSSGGYYLVNKNTRYQTYNIPSYTFATAVNCNQYSDATGQPSLTRIGLVLGSGTTNPTIEDVKVQTPITTLTSISASNNLATADDTWGGQSLLEFTQTVKNNTSDAITVSEVALFANGSDTGATLVFTRDVITPVTIAVGETKTFVLSINLENLATNVSA